MADDGNLLIQDLMRFLPDGMTANSWAVKAGVSRTIWADMRRHGNPSRRTLEKLLAAAGSSLAEFEALRIGYVPRQEAGSSLVGVADARTAGWRAAPLPPIPVLATAVAGEWGKREAGVELTELREQDVCAHVPRPPSLAGDRDAYAVTILGDSMWPRFRAGRRLLVSPACSVGIGDDVLLGLADTEGRQTAGSVRMLIKELVRRYAGIVELRQFNPDVKFRIEADEIASIHKVVGEAI